MMTPALEQLKDIIIGGLCHRCGACAAVCPRGVIMPDQRFYPSVGDRVGECTDCGLCVRVCPGKRFETAEYSQSLFGTRDYTASPHGFFLKAFLGHAAESTVREKGTSGGIATGIPFYLLRRGSIRGAFTVALDPHLPWKPLPLIARNERDLRKGSSSKYPACSLNHLWNDVPKDEGPFVFTGLPCHVQGLRKLMRYDRKIAGRVAVTVGLFCHSCLEHQVVRDILRIYGISEGEITEFDYRGGKLPGYIRARIKGGDWVYLPYPRKGPSAYRPNAKECLTLFFKLYSPPRCRLCADATAEFADISVGDPWFKGWEGEEKLRKGYSMILARTERGLKILEEAQTEGMIELEPFPGERARMSHLPMIRSKKMRALYNIEKRRKKKLPVPEYGEGRNFGFGERCRAALHRLTYSLADRPKLRVTVMRLLLSGPGRFMVGALFFRRRVMQAWWERLKRRREPKR
jgi:coenzyme F420 hydrogenase subunit beta